MSKNVAIIGSGAWGNALYHVLGRNTPVKKYGRGEEVSEKIIVIAVPTQNIRELTSVISTPPEKLTIINTAKGIEQESQKLPHQIVEELFPGSIYLSLIGPGFAREVMENMPTLVNLGYGQEEKRGKMIASLFETDTFRVRPCEAIHILELSSALKNIYAIGCGLVDGLGYGMNTRTMLTVLAYEEMQSLFIGLGLGSGPLSYPGTIGDLILTCNSHESRNFTFGRTLANKTVTEALGSAKGVVEGYTSLNALDYYERKASVSLPLARFIYETIQRNNPKTTLHYFTEFTANI